MFKKTLQHQFSAWQHFVVLQTQASPHQGCQIFIGTKHQNRKNTPNYHELFQMSIKYNKRLKMDQVLIKYTIIFHCKTLQTLTKSGFLV
jgi:hypothetical protein